MENIIYYPMKNKIFRSMLFGSHYTCKQSQVQKMAAQKKQISKSLTCDVMVRSSRGGPVLYHVTHKCWTIDNIGVFRWRDIRLFNQLSLFYVMSLYVVFIVWKKKIFTYLQCLICPCQPRFNNSLDHGDCRHPVMP